jgi:Zn ribbon nucleic-acid-binding protein
MVNTNCLVGIKCPDCGNEDSFYIQSTAVMYVTDGGAECRGDTEWNDDSHTECPQCERSGKLADFRAKPPVAAEAKGDRS